MKKKKMSRDEKAVRDVKMKEDMKNPINQFLNAVDNDGKILYPLAEKLRKYFLNNPDPALNAIMMSNALLHEIRWHKETAKQYYNNYLDKDKPVSMFDQNGKQLSRDECYVAWIKETQLCHTVVSKLRTHLINGLLPTVDNEVFNYQEFNDYVLEVEKKLKEMGYDLFPEKVEVINPL